MTRTTRETRSSKLRFARSRTSSPSFARDSTSSSIRECINFPTIESERDAFDPRSIRSTLTRRRVRSRSARSVTASVDVRSIASRRVAVSRVGRRRAFHSQIASNHFPWRRSWATHSKCPNERSITHTKDLQNSSNVHEHAVYRQLSSATAAWMTSGGRPRSHTGGDSIVSPDSRIDALYGTIRDSCVPPSPGIEMNGGV